MLRSAPDFGVPAHKFQGQATCEVAVSVVVADVLSQSLPPIEGTDECVTNAAQHSHKHGEFHGGEPCQVYVNQTLIDRSGE